MKMPTKIYERLTPDERFRVFVEAAGRRDEEELDRLNATCAMKTCRIEDPDYFLRKTNATIITLCAHVDAAWFSELACFSMALLTLGSGKHDQMAIDSLSVFVRRYRTQMMGFEKFCEAIGVNAESMRQACGCRVGPINRLALEIAEDYASAAPVPEEIDAAANQLLARWRLDVPL